MKSSLLLTLGPVAVCSLLAGTTAFAQDAASSKITLELLPGEAWWGGADSRGDQMPFGIKPVEFNLEGNDFGNQAAPLLLSSKGRYVWCEQAFRFTFATNTLQATSPGNTIQHGEAGQDLRAAYRFASKKFFPPDGKLPELSFFTAPQYNTWIELMHDQNQRDVLKYAHGIVDNGLPPGVLMIDNGWQDGNYGRWVFHSGRFPDPKAMMMELHDLGFKVMLWVCPFVSPDGEEYKALRKYAFVMERPGDPAMVDWWEGKSAMLDLSNPQAKSWFMNQLADLQKTYGVDGFKFDAGDCEFYKPQYLTHEKLDVNDQARLYAEIGLAFPFNEYRASWKIAGRPLVQRLRDKNHAWEDLQKLVPDMIAAGLMGYTFVCPDMIGGGEAQSFLHLATVDQDLVVRSAQVHALAPMMQFSVAPWRVLDPAHLKAVLKAVQLREKHISYIVNLARQSASTGEPMMRSLEYGFPHQGYERVTDQFLLGDQILVAPVVEKDARNRTVMLPPGRWQGFDGKRYAGPTKVTLPVSFDELCYFEKAD